MKLHRYFFRFKDIDFSDNERVTEISTAKEQGSQFVMTMTKHHKDWCTLPDLSSRLATLSTFTLNLPGLKWVVVQIMHL